MIPRHYIGTAAEIGGITGVCGDTAYETDTDIYKHWNGTAWITGGIPFHVDLFPNAVDIAIGGFTTNGVAQVDGIDLTGIVPVGTIGVDLRIHLLDDAVGSHLDIYHSAAAVETKHRCYTQVANIDIEENFSLPISADRCLDYVASNLVFTAIDLTVLGYTICRCQ